MRKHLDIKIWGEVQGVGFRYSARVRAEGLGITGFARNEPGGAVYIEAEGGEKEIGEFVEWCKEGPGGARVEGVEAEEGEVKNFKDFSII